MMGPTLPFCLGRHEVDHTKLGHSLTTFNIDVQPYELELLRQAFGTEAITI